MTHVLRHTFGAHFMMNNGNILTLKELLGHSKIETTMVYAHFSPNYLKDALSHNPMCAIRVQQKTR
jgi:site-specific recombinase XerD